MNPEAIICPHTKNHSAEVIFIDYGLEWVYVDCKNCSKMFTVALETKIVETEPLVDEAELIANRNADILKKLEEKRESDKNG